MWMLNVSTKTNRRPSRWSTTIHWGCLGVATSKTMSTGIRHVRFKYAVSSFNGWFFSEIRVSKKNSIKQGLISNEWRPPSKKRTTCDSFEIFFCFFFRNNLTFVWGKYNFHLVVIFESLTSFVKWEIGCLICFGRVLMWNNELSFARHPRANKVTNWSLSNTVNGKYTYNF